MKELFQTPATVQGFKTLVDGGNKLDIITQELPPEEAAKLLSLRGKIGWFVFSTQDIEQKDIPEVKVDIQAGEKTPSQRLRAVIYKHWELNTDQKTDKDLFYKQQMESIINLYKEKLT